MFKNFQLSNKKVNGVKINFRIGGTGKPLLLLHGYPQTHIMWREIAPSLAKNFTVICSDLRGYGDSDKPASDKEHKTYSKTVMAKDQHELMKSLGYNEYFVIGHDRGARVAHRMAIDYQGSVLKLVVLDIVPTLHVFENTEQNLARRYYHWYFLIQPFPHPETLIANSAEFYLKSKLAMWGSREGFIKNEILDEYLRCFANKDTIHATCEDYRAGASIDLIEHKRDFNKKIVCPLLVLWGKKGTVEELYNPIKVWNDWALNVRGNSLDCGHFLPEEKPEDTYNAIINFLE
tara:strand:- start:103 stop:972 length:870 start_codon:yes stop_codon:yes gene_type:complete